MATDTTIRTEPEEVNVVTAALTSHDRWMRSVGIPIHRGYHVEDLRTLELGWWPERECGAAYLVLSGQEGKSEVRVTEIPPGKTLPPVKFALDEIVYVVEGRGLTTIRAGAESQWTTFEWQKRSMFLLPRNCETQLSNAQGNSPARLLHYNFLPMAMSISPDPHFYFDNPYTDASAVGDGDDVFSDAKELAPSVEAAARGAGRVMWYGNFFPDMGAWDRLHIDAARGAGSERVGIQFVNSSMRSHMSVFAPRLYKKAHRHGPGVVIVIPAGEGYSVMWREGQERVVIPWHEGSVFVPPARWFHQHFNVGGVPARYLAFHLPRGLTGGTERVQDRALDQIEYPDEDPWIRQKFESELAQRGLTTLMPPPAYLDREYRWAGDEDDED
jgi:hypothetical protein